MLCRWQCIFGHSLWPWSQWSRFLLYFMMEWVEYLTQWLFMVCRWRQRLCIAYDLRVKGQGQINMNICFKACDTNLSYIVWCKVFIFGKMVPCGVYRTIKLSDRWYRGSYMSAHFLLNLLNELGKRDKMRGLPSILSFFRNEFNKFNNTRARMLDSIYHMTNTLKSHFWRKNVIILSLCT